MMISFRRLTVILVLASAGSAAAAQTKIGAAGAVSGLVKAMEPQETVGRVIESGKPLFLNDHVTTDAKGRLQVMLLDETVFTIGPNSDMVLDEFVYDPATDAGKVSAKITKGVFRFVTGKVARKDPANMKVKLAVGTIGIRGTIAAGTTDEQGSTVVLLGPGAQNNANENAGAITVENGSSQVLVDQPGFGVNVTPGQENLSVTDMSAQAGQITSALSSENSGEPAGNAPDSGGGTSAPSGSEESGQTTALAGVSLDSSADSSLVAQVLDETASQAQQDIVSNPVVASIVDGIASWDNVRSIESGLATYSGSGTCADPTVNMDFDLEVDFGARTYGGNTSGISLTYMVESVVGSTSILQKSFGDLTGQAVITLDGTNSSSSYFNGTTITFNNLNGTAAKDVTVALNFSDPQGFPSTVTGELTAPRVP